MYFQVGKGINEDILQNEGAEYGKMIIDQAEALRKQYGRSFEVENLPINFLSILKKILSPKRYFPYF